MIIRQRERQGKAVKYTDEELIILDVVISIVWLISFFASLINVTIGLGCWCKPLVITVVVAVCLIAIFIAAYIAFCILYYFVWPCLTVALRHFGGRQLMASKDLRDLKDLNFEIYCAIVGLADAWVERSSYFGMLALFTVLAVVNCWSIPHYFAEDWNIITLTIANLMGVFGSIVTITWLNVRANEFSDEDGIRVILIPDKRT